MINKTFKTVIKDGRKFNLLTLPGTKYFKFEIVNNYGSNIERVIEQKTGKNLYGISHLIEHLSIKASKDYTTEEIIDIKTNKGNQNASTTFDTITYWFETNMDNLDLAINFNSNIAFNDLSKLTQSEFDTEKKVVSNEVKRYNDDDQTMFYFNSITNAMGYKKEDNIIGTPKTIESLQLKDAQGIKNIFLNNNEHIYNVVYDSELILEEELIAKIEKEISRFIPETKDYLTVTKDEYTNGLSSPIKDVIKIANESEQAMTTILIDGIKNTLLLEIVCEYLAEIAENTSLNQIIREKNGLTYGIGFGPIILAYKPYISFVCDVTKGTEKKMVELFKESISLSCENFTEEQYKKFMQTTALKRTINLLNQENYTYWFNFAYENPQLIKKYADLFAKNINDVYEVLDKELLNYTNMKNTIKMINAAVKNNNYSLITNV